jgi:hypothetical protein
MDGEVNSPLQRLVARFVRLRRTGWLTGLKPGHYKIYGICSG